MQNRLRALYGTALLQDSHGEGARKDGGRALALDILARAEEPSPVGVVVTLDKAQVMRPCEE